MALERLEPNPERLNDAATEAHCSPERTLKEIFTEHSCLFHLCKMETFVFGFFLFASPSPGSHNSAGSTHAGLSVGKLGRRKLSANQVAPGRKSSCQGCEIVFHSVPNTAAFCFRKLFSCERF